MNIGIKYCGGCNPRYDRKEFLDALKKKFNFDFEIVRPDEVYDVVIVLCGCSSCCADQSELKFKFEKILVNSKEDFYEVQNLLKKYFNM